MMDVIYPVVCVVFGILLLGVFIWVHLRLSFIQIDVDYLTEKEQKISSQIRHLKCEVQRLEDKLYIDVPISWEENSGPPMSQRFPIGKLIGMLMENYTITAQDEYVLKGKKECEKPLP
jgi:hypothetical protein